MSAQPHEIYHALGDPTRLAIVERLMRGGPQTTLTLVDGLGMSRQAATKHLVLLENAGLVVSRTEGRNIVREIQPKVISEAAEWLDTRARAWENKLEALRRLVEDSAP